MDDTAEYERQFEPAPTAPLPARPEASRFDPWVGIAYHVVQVLFVVVAAVVAANLIGDLTDLLNQARAGLARTQFLFTLGLIGVPAIGMAIALRLGQLDLSIGAMATFATAIYAVNDGGSSALLTVIGTALLVGVVTGAVSAWLRIPSWLSTLALSFMLLALFYALVSPDNPIRIAGEQPARAATPVLAVAFLILGLGAVVVFLVLDVLRRPAQVKRIEDVALGGRILLTAGALAISAGFAAYTGAMQVERVRAVATGGLESLLPAILAAVLIGGVGVFGGRVSLAGTMLGAFGMALIQYGVQLAPDPAFSTRLLGNAIPLIVFLILRGAVGALRNERIPA